MSTGNPVSAPSTSSGTTARSAKAFGRRIVGVVPLLIAVTVLVFLVQNLGGSPARAILGQAATPHQVAVLNHQMGLDRPILSQYFSYLGGLLHGDLGKSYYSGQSVSSLIASRLGVTLSILGMSLLISLVVAVPLAMVSAERRGGRADKVVRQLCLAGIALPPFWVGIMLVLIFALPTGLLPVGGWGNNVNQHLTSLVIPSVTMAIAIAPVQIRTLRSSLLATLGKEYVEAARSRGVASFTVLRRHALPNSVRPLISIVAVQAGYMLFTTVMVENVFELPGLGQGLVLAVGQRDQPVVDGTALVFAVLSILISLISDGFILAFDMNHRMAKS